MLVSEQSGATHKSSDVAETEEFIRFEKSLQELRDIRSQLHYAADYCESTFLNTNEKKAVVENTKEYICRAVVTVVDHLGNVSSNLTSQLSYASSFSDADAELRIDSLQQRMVSCEQFKNEFALAKVRWSPAVPRHYPRYILSITEEKSSLTARTPDSTTSKAKDEQKFGTEEGLPLFLYTFPTKPSLPRSSSAGDINSASLVPIKDGLQVLPKARNASFHFQGTHKKLPNGLHRRSMHGSDMLSRIRRIRLMS